MSKTKSVLLFISGTVVGGLSAYFLTKKKYESIVEIELRDLRETYRRRTEELFGQDRYDGPQSELVADQPFRERSSLDIQREKSAANINKPPIRDYTKYYPSTDSDDIEIKEPVNYAPVDKDPYVISPDQFGAEPGYSESHYTLHPNGCITDDDDGEEIDDIPEILGSNWDKRIGEYEANTVQIRNERLMMDIEIVQILPPEPIVENPIVFKTSPNPATSRRPHEVDN